MKKTDVRSLGQQLRQIKSDRGLTMEKMAEETGISAATLYRVMLGYGIEPGTATMTLLKQFVKRHKVSRKKVVVEKYRLVGEP